MRQIFKGAAASAPLPGCLWQLSFSSDPKHTEPASNLAKLISQAAC